MVFYTVARNTQYGWMLSVAYCVLRTSYPTLFDSCHEFHELARIKAEIGENSWQKTRSGKVNLQDTGKLSGG
jgi:hypothetical protein